MQKAPIRIPGGKTRYSLEVTLRLTQGNSVISRSAPSVGLRRRIMRKLGVADDAMLEAGAAGPAEGSQEGGVDWWHLRVENVGLPKAQHVQPAKGAWAEVHIDGRRFRLVWSTSAGPKHYVTIRKGDSALIPLVVRARFASAVLHPRPGAAFVTDLRALLYQNDESRLLEPGKYRVTLELHWDPEQSREVNLVLTIPPEKHVRMSLERER